jgi:tetratricopeptide (TPR) repeat protein
MYSCCMRRSGPLLFVLLAATAASPVNPHENFDQIAKQADAARSADRISDAIHLYIEAIHLRPTWREGWWSLASLLYDQDRFAEADSAFRHFIALTPKRGPAYAFLGLCEYETRDYDGAIQNFRAWASAGWPGTSRLIDVGVFHFALLLTREGKFVEALYLLSPMAAKLGYTPAVTEAMGLASLHMRNVPEDYPPERREMIWLAGEAAAHASGASPDFPRANEYADKLMRYYHDRPEVHYFRGTIFAFENKSADAEREYREELRISPQHVAATLAIASVDLGNGQLQEAGSLARRAAELDPKNAEAHHLLGRVLMSTGDLQGSIRELEIAKQLAPDSAIVRSHLAMVYGRLGRSQEAKSEAAIALALKNKENVLAPPEEKVKSNGSGSGKAR